MNPKRHFPYPITVRILNGYFEVSAPDFGIIKAKKRIEEIHTAEEMGTLILEVMNEALTQWMSLKHENKPTPSASKPRGALDSIEIITEPLIPMREAQALLQVSDETVRRLCKKGELIPHLTPGGHRKFRLSEVQAHLKKKRV
jgi:excisionase family DNA binding protein